MRALRRLRIPDFISTDSHMSVVTRSIGKVSAHWHDYYEVELCLAGDGVTEINNAVYPMRKGTLSFLSPSDVHSITPNGQVTLLNFSFAPCCIEASSLYELVDLQGPGCFALDDGDFARITFLIRTLGEETDRCPHQYKEYASHMLACLLIEITRLGKAQSSAVCGDSTAVQKVLYFVHAHFKENISLEEAAAYAGISAGYAGKLFQKSLGKSFKEFLTELRLRQAEQLLLYTAASVTEITYFCGFGSMTHFLRVFKKHYGISPAAFRKKRQSTDQGR